MVKDCATAECHDAISAKDKPEALMAIECEMFEK